MNEGVEKGEETERRGQFVIPFTNPVEPVQEARRGEGGGWKSSASTEISIFRTCIDRVHDGEHVYREIAIASCNRLISPPLSLRFLPDFHLPSTAGLLINEELPRPLDSIRIARITSSIFCILYSLSEFIFSMSRRQE